MIKKIDEKYIINLIIILTIVFPYLNLFHLLLPGIILGKSVWVAFPIIILTLIYLYLINYEEEKIKIYDLIFFYVACFLLIITQLRELIYNENENILNYRFVITSLLFILLFKRLLICEKNIRTFAITILFQGLLIASIRLINYFYFPNLMISYRDGINGPEAFLNFSGELTRDLLLASSFSANHIICSMFALLLLKITKSLNISDILFILIQIFMLVALITSLSRFPIFIAFIITIFSLFYLRKNNIIILFSLALIFILLINNANILTLIFHRFHESSGGRFDKLLIIFFAVFNSLTDFLIGSSNQFINNLSYNGTVFSDNSYGFVLIMLGIPLGIIYISTIFLLLPSANRNFLSIFFLSYIILCLGFTNSILWESWIFTSFFVYFLSCWYKVQLFKL